MTVGVAAAVETTVVLVGSVSLTGSEAGLETELFSSSFFTSLSTSFLVSCFSSFFSSEALTVGATVLTVVKNPKPGDAVSAGVAGTLKMDGVAVSGFAFSGTLSVSKMERRFSARRLSFSRSLSKASMLVIVGFRDSGRRSETVDEIQWKAILKYRF